MKVHGLTRGVAAIILTVGAAGSVALARGDEPAKAAATAANPVAEGVALLRNLAGEWEGNIQTRNPDGTTSSSIVSASNRVEKDGKALASVYQGFAFGKATDGALALSVQNSGKLTTAMSREGQSLQTTATAANNAMTAKFENTLAGFKSGKLEQSLRMTDANHYTLELVNVDGKGNRTVCLKLDMTRLDAGQLSAAAASFESSKAMAMARSAADSLNDSDSAVQTAGVETP